MRCKHFIRGFFGRRPVPYHADAKAWMAGMECRVYVCAVGVVLALVGLGVVIGMKL